MSRPVFRLGSVLLVAVAFALGQQQQQGPPAPRGNPPPPRSDSTHGPNDSSSLDNPRSAPAGDSSSDLTEMRPWDPHKAAKDIEVGDYYFKRGNYPAATSRYREALEYKPNDALATFRLATSLEKTGDLEDAVKSYQAYLRLLPEGPFAKDARKALNRLEAQLKAVSVSPQAQGNARAIERELEAGRQSLKIEDYPGALQHFRGVLQIDPQNEAAHYWVARVQEQSGSLPDACRSYSGYLREFPKGAYATQAKQSLELLQPELKMLYPDSKPVEGCAGPPASATFRSE